MLFGLYSDVVRQPDGSLPSMGSIRRPAYVIVGKHVTVTNMGGVGPPTFRAAEVWVVVDANTGQLLGMSY